MGLGDQAAGALARITSLVHTIDLATSHLVVLHLEVQDAVDPVEPIADVDAELGGVAAPAVRARRRRGRAPGEPSST